MKVIFERKREVALDFDVKKVGDYIVEEYKKNYGVDEDPNCEYIYDEVSNNLMEYLKAFGLTDEDEDDIIDCDIEGYDCLKELEEAVQAYIEINYQF